MLLLGARHLKNRRKEVYFALKSLVSGQEKAGYDCCTTIWRWKPGKMLNFGQLSTSTCWAPSLGAWLHGVQHRKHRRSLPGWASLSGRSMRQRSPLKAGAPSGKPLSDGSQKQVLPQDHPVSVSPSPQCSVRGSACARSLLQTALLGMARTCYSSCVLII